MLFKKFPTAKNISDCDGNIEAVCKRHASNKRYLCLKQF